MAKDKIKPNPIYTATDEDARQDIGNLTELTTTNKDDLVGAINELDAEDSGIITGGSGTIALGSWQKKGNIITIRLNTDVFTAIPPNGTLTFDTPIPYTFTQFIYTTAFTEPNTFGRIDMFPDRADYVTRVGGLSNVAFRGGCTVILD